MATPSHDVQLFNAEEIPQDDAQYSGSSRFGLPEGRVGIGLGHAKPSLEDHQDLWRTYLRETAFFEQDVPGVDLDAVDALLVIVGLSSSALVVQQPECTKKLSSISAELHIVAAILSRRLFLSLDYG